MDVFELRNKIVEDYTSFVQGFIKIKDPAIKSKVGAELDGGLLWPEPIVQLSPAFERGESIEDLVEDGTLHPSCEEIFTRKGSPLKLFKHQTEAVRRARQNLNYVLTTGTGSGKSLTYIIPIIDHILRTGSGGGVKAIVVYPMNALANSQQQELEKFPDPKDPDYNLPFTFARYTGQETDEEKKRIRNNPPDILLTNFVMLELLLTRVDELEIVDKMHALRFIVLDELHTYRGRQGADVAMLVRRTREASGSKDVICVGTSATLASGSTRKEQAKEVAKTATALFGAPVAPEDVINEYLVRETPELDEGDADAVRRLKEEVEFLSGFPSDSEALGGSFVEHMGAANGYQALKTSALASWIESTFGVQKEEESGAYIRQKPIPITGEKSGARRLAEKLDLDEDKCAAAIKNLFMLGYRTENAVGRPFFSFRLHQFISRGDYVYATAELGEDRHVYMRKQIYAPGENREKKIFPLVFCRHCGKEFYCVNHVNDIEGERFEARDPFDDQEIAQVDKKDLGYLYASKDNPWPDDDEEIAKRLPEEWLDYQGKPTRDKTRIPKRYRINLLGETVDPDQDGYDVAFIPSPFLFCPECGVSYSAMHTKRAKQDFYHLGSVSVGGRAIATTILSLSVARRLQETKLKKEAQKLLSFTDNRQDASFQAGHFNDFVEVSVLRGALYQALLNAGPEGFSFNEAAQGVIDCLNLDYKEYAKSDETKKGAALKHAKEQLKDVICFRLFCDLQRGVRLQVPNLEQTGLLEIDYEELDELVRDEVEWSGKHPALVQATPETRKKLLLTILNELRRSLAVNYFELQRDNQWNFLQNSSNWLNEKWSFDKSEKDHLPSASVAYLCSKTNDDKPSQNGFYISSRSGIGRHIRSAAFQNYPTNLSLGETEQILNDVFSVLVVYGLVQKIELKGRPTGYQLDAALMRWKLGNGTVQHYDPIRQPGESREQDAPNEFYQSYYKIFASSLGRLEGREHTAQVSYEDREEREKEFRKGDLPVLFCSPTMELGVDISELNVVHMRNIPPTPANYAQRSGRAGRSGQPALILSYCTSGSQHDQFFFLHPDQMVSGAVQTPRIDLANERLIRSHVQAIWLSEAAKKRRFSLGSSLKEVLNTEDFEPGSDIPKCELEESVVDALQDNRIKESAMYHARKVLNETKEELKNAPWYSDDWLEGVFKQLLATFTEACERWRSLYRSAIHQRNLQNRIWTQSPEARKRAERLRAQAESEIKLLEDTKNPNKSEFYSYRYFASEGFLPGYNFPRLPVTAFLPGARGSNSGDDYLSRPRFLAINEFGPRAVIYHEGAHYMVDQITLPVGDSLSKEGTLSFKGARVCPQCGYYHTAADNADVCEFCGALLAGSLDNLVEFKNVTARRRERINCDEDDRTRTGYDLTTSFKFAERNEVQSSKRAEIFLNEDGERMKWGDLIYGPSATIYKINNGKKKTPSEKRNGFLLDVELGRWIPESKEEQFDDEDASLDEKRARKARPYVEDTKNCILIRPSKELNNYEFASLQAALKRAIQQRYSIEESELATFPLPNETDRKIIFFYEASEGGAGVLQQLLSEDEFRATVREALSLCHYDPDTEKDLGKAEHASELCDAACYDCLLSYSNQRDHKFLDRNAIKKILLKLRGAELVVSSGPAAREVHLKKLMAETESQLERKWLDFIDSKKCKLPSRAQVYLEEANTRPDFIYDDEKVAIYVDGPPHDYESAAKNDRVREDGLMLAGWSFIRFRYDADWGGILKENSQLFGLD